MRGSSLRTRAPRGPSEGSERSEESEDAEESEEDPDGPVLACQLGRLSLMFIATFDWDAEFVYDNSAALVDRSVFIDLMEDKGYPLKQVKLLEELIQADMILGRLGSK